jgi:hypothetical protein
MARRVIPLTRSRALILAAKYGLAREVAYLIDHKDLSPEEALSEWDIL